MSQPNLFLPEKGTYSNNMFWSIGILQLMQWSAAYVGRLLASLEKGWVFVFLFNLLIISINVQC